MSAGKCSATEMVGLASSSVEEVLGEGEGDGDGVKDSRIPWVKRGEKRALFFTEDAFT